MRQTPAHQFISTRAFLRKNILCPDVLPRHLVDHCKLDGVSGFSIHKSERWPGVSGNRPFTSHLSERLHHKSSVPTLWGQNVFVSLGIDLISPPLDQFVVFQDASTDRTKSHWSRRSIGVAPRICSTRATSRAESAQPSGRRSPPVRRQSSTPSRQNFLTA
jgi:hypothetical protein